MAMSATSAGYEEAWGPAAEEELLIAGATTDASIIGQKNNLREDTAARSSNETSLHHRIYHWVDSLDACCTMLQTLIVAK